VIFAGLTGSKHPLRAYDDKITKRIFPTMSFYFSKTGKRGLAISCGLELKRLIKYVNAQYLDFEQVHP
jgi:hypothetical protein